VLPNLIFSASRPSWQNNILVFAALEGVPDQVGNAPDEIDLLSEVIHELSFSAL
jgi:hypothetical protein